MAIYSLGIGGSTTVVGTAASACWGLLAPSNQATTVLEFIYTTGSTTGGTIGLGIAAAAGTQTSGVAVQSQHGTDTTTGHSTGAIAWSAAPTVPSAFFCRAEAGKIIGDPTIFLFPRGLIVPSSSELVCWNIAATSTTASFTVTVDE